MYKAHSKTLLKFQIILADPPWRFRNWSMSQLVQRGEKWARGHGRSPYPVMTTEDICKLPVGDIADRDSLLLMWATAPKMEDAFQVINAWGFSFVTVAFTWVKLNPSGIGWHFGPGYHTRQNAEFILLGARGKGISRVDRAVPSLIVYPRGRHSRKPPAARERIERLYGPAHRIELFARQTAPGWDAWGNEVECSPYALPLANYISPPYTALVDEDEYQGLPVEETRQPSYNYGEQMALC